MYEYRRALLRMRSGNSDREIACQRLMGRKKARKLRQVAQAEGWLEAGAPLPEDAVLRPVVH